MQNQNGSGPGPGLGPNSMQETEQRWNFATRSDPEDLECGEAPDMDETPVRQYDGFLITVETLIEEVHQRAIPQMAATIAPLAEQVRQLTEEVRSLKAKIGKN